jgi:hypothetical protein
LVYSLCVKSQIRYPAGFAPWTPAQYQELDRAPAELFRNIYGLRRTSPTALIYAPRAVGGREEQRISDAAQLQKWQYLHSTAHSAQTVTALLHRALSATPADPPLLLYELDRMGTQDGLNAPSDLGAGPPPGDDRLPEASNYI